MSTLNVDNNTAETQAATALPGRTLKQARESRRISVEDAAQALNLRVYTLKSLENDDYKALPAPTFIRGYIRAYAKFLGLDDESLVRLYQPDDQVLPPIKPLHNIGKAGFTRKFHARFFIISFLLLLVVIIGLAIFWWADQKNGTQADTSNETLLEQVAIEGIDGNLHVQSLDELDAQTARLEVEEIILSRTPKLPAEHAESTAQKAQPAEAQSSHDGSSGVRLELSFLHDCWIRITDVDGKEISSGLKRAGEVLNLTGKTPFELHLGYATGVIIKFNGEEVDFKSSIRGNVARIKLG